jgi:prevent-host-death family protein
MVRQVNIHEAKTRLSQLLARVQKGEEIIIAKAGVPVARLVSVNNNPTARVPGSAKSKIIITADFDAPLPEALMESFEK